MQIYKQFYPEIQCQGYQHLQQHIQLLNNLNLILSPPQQSPMSQSSYYPSNYTQFQQQQIAYQNSQIVNKTQQIQLLQEQLQQSNNITMNFQKVLEQYMIQNKDLQFKQLQQPFNFSQFNVNEPLSVASNKTLSETQNSSNQQQYSFVKSEITENYCPSLKAKPNQIEIITKVETVEVQSVPLREQKKQICTQEMAKQKIQTQIQKQSDDHKKDLLRLEHLYQEIAKKVEKQNKQKQEEKIELKKKKKVQSLAQRNTKINFASGLYNFIQFKIYLARKRKQWNMHETLFKLSDFIKANIKTFQSYDGWKILLTDETYGVQLQKMSRLFFKKTYAFDYITNSRINKNYLDEHLKLINKFKIASKRPQLFSPNHFKLLKE